MRRRKRRSARNTDSRSYRRPLGFRRPLRIEPLEDRRMLAVLTVTTNQDMVDVADGVISLREAIFSANTVPGADTIEFDFGHEGPETLVLTQGELVITDSVTIAGAGADLLTIDASGNDPTPDENNGDGSRVFNISDGNSGTLIDVTIVGLNVTGGDSAATGGGIMSSDSHLTIRDAIISGNSSSDQGGGIRFRTSLNDLDSKLSIENTSIAGNFAGSSGGGVSVEGDSETEIRDAKIENNIALVFGGGIDAAALGQLGPRVRIYSSTMTGNKANTGGGVNGNGMQLEVFDTAIIKNVAERGAGIYLFGGSESSHTAEIRNCNIDENLGGGIRAFRMTLINIKDSTIRDNRANPTPSQSGIGISLNANVVTIAGCTITNNENLGINFVGAFGDATFTLTDSLVEGNALGVFLSESDALISNSIIAANRNHGISVVGSTLSVTGGSISDNAGAGIYSMFSELMINDSTINGNVSTISGGGIYSDNGNLTVVRSTIHGNKSDRAGGGVYVAWGNVTVTESTISGNKAGTGAGGIHHASNGSQQLQVIESTISNNEGSRGGGVFSGEYAMFIDSTISGNRATEEGGGISAVERVVLLRSAVTDNRTTGSNRSGGGISVLGAADLVLIQDSSVSNNSATGSGGGIHTSAAVRVTRSSILGNTAFAHGGGIQAPAQTITVTDSTVARNRTTGPNAQGGGIVGGSVTITQSTISGNRTEGTTSSGGGIAASQLTLNQSMVVDNHALAANAMGGGIQVSGVTQLNGSIIADNSAGGGNPDIRTGSFVAPNYSLVGSTSGLTAVQLNLLNTGVGNLLNTDPKLGPLAFNGGPTFADGSKMLTHALLAGSPAIDAGDLSAAAGVGGVPEFDQRGMPFGRIVDGDGAGGARIDMGAYERTFGETYSFVVDTLEDESDGNYSLGDFSLREAIELANANPGKDTIEFDAALWAEGPATIVLSLGELSITDAVSIAGPGAQLITIDASGSDPTPNSTLTDGDDTNDGDGTTAFAILDVDFEDRFDVELSGITITGGDSPGAGAIGSNVALRLVEVVVSGNRSTNKGGAIAQISGVLTIIDSVISHNDARKDGGGVFVFAGSLSIVGSVISNNTTRDDFGMGGGIAVDNILVATDPDSFVRIERSLISQNVARGTFAPGGISISSDTFSNPSNPIEVTIVGSTISENTASGNVAGIYLYGAEATIADSTVSSNRWVARGGVGGSVEQWRGGIFLDSSDLTLVRSTVVDNVGFRPFLGLAGNGIQVLSGNVVLDHSIVVRNTSVLVGGDPADIVSSGLVSAQSSLIGAAEGIVDGGGNMIGTPEEPIDPLLGPLAYNGGPVFFDGTRMFTHAPLPGSPAIDAGDPAAVAGVDGVPEFDQRGMPWSRVANGDDVPEARIDIGAVELQVNPLAGDYNFNGIVDAADYVVWRNTVGSTNDLRADGSGAIAGVPDGVVDQLDYAFWKSSFGNVLQEESGAGTNERGAGSTEQGILGEGIVAGELRLAAGGASDATEFENTAVTAAIDLRPALVSVPARRSSPAIGRGLGLSVVVRDDALLAWVARRGDTSAFDGVDEELKSDAVEASDSTVGILDKVFARLGCEF